MSQSIRRTATHMTVALALCAAAVSCPAQQPLEARQTLLAAAEAALARGMASSALIGFERAGMMQHAADAELGLVRAWMQQGEYRRALAFAAHTSGAHRDVPAASAFYAWLLRLAGQDRFARSLLERTRDNAPEDPFVRQAHAAFGHATPMASGVLLDPPHRLAPQPVMRGDQPSPPDTAAVIASGVLVHGGRQAWVPASVVASGPRRLWVRNGLGVGTLAVVDPVGSDALKPHGVVVLDLADTLGEASAELAERDPHAGSPAWVAGFGTGPGVEAAWPWLTQGFVGTVGAVPGTRRLGFTLPQGQTGGPVLNMAGRLVGLALHVPGAPDRLVPVSLLRSATSGQDGAEPVGSAPAAASGEAPPRLAPDQLYETALRIGVQVIALP